MTVIFNPVNPSDAGGNWYFPATAGPVMNVMHAATTAAAGCFPPVTMHYGTDVSGSRYTAMTSTTATAQATWGIQYIARTYGGEEVTARGLTWRVRSLTDEELTG